MHTNNRPARRGWLIVGYMGIIVMMLACAVSGGGQLSEDGLIQIEDGVVEVQNDDGDWVPVGGASFELVGELVSTDPWTVAGTEFETRETTKIEDGLEAGDLVRVRGVVLEDETWVAYFIELADEQTDPTLILIGTVDSIDPWVVDGITLTVTEETDIQGDIKVGTIVRVEILLLSDGTWEVLSIAPLGELTDVPDCATVIATVVSVDGNEVQFLGWPTTVTIELEDDKEENSDAEDGDDDEEDGDDDENDDEDEGEDDDNDGTDVIVLTSDQVVLAVVCVSDGQLVIVQIFILDVDEDDGDSAENGEKVLICHKPDKNPHTLSLPQSAIPAHLGHGDLLGACP